MRSVLSLFTTGLAMSASCRIGCSARSSWPTANASPPADLELTDAMNALPPQTLKEARESLEREIVQAALRRHAGKITSAALELGISRPTLYELMEKLGIARE